MFLDPLQTSNYNYSIPSPNVNPPPIDPALSLDKRSSSRIDPFATHACAWALAGYIKQKCLKSTILAPVQSYLNASIDQTKGKNNYQSVYKEKLVKIIQSLLTTD